MFRGDKHISDGGADFNFLLFVQKIRWHYKWLLLSLLVCIFAVYQLSLRTQPRYRIATLIAIKDDPNPFFSSNTSLTFNWGGSTDLVQTAMVILKSRSHNEAVVEELQLFVDYQQDSRYKRVDVYGQTPFKLKVDTNRFQGIGQEYRLVFLDSVQFELTVCFPDGRGQLQHINRREKIEVSFTSKCFEKNFKLNEELQLPFLNGSFSSNGRTAAAGEEYFVKITDFDEVVRRYQELQISQESDAASVLELSHTGQNKSVLVSYLNGSVRILSETLLDRKNQYATNTLHFLDSSLLAQADKLQQLEWELDYIRQQQIPIIPVADFQLTDELMALDSRQEALNAQLRSYETLQLYVQEPTVKLELPLPSSMGIEEEQVHDGLNRLLSLARAKRKYEYSLKETAPVLRVVERELEVVRAMLLENMISSRQVLHRELLEVEKRIQENENKIRQLPQTEREFVKLQRKYALAEQTQMLFDAKRREAALVKAANVSDVRVIDPAKDAGITKIGPNTTLHYAMAVLVGGLIPVSCIFLSLCFDNRLQHPREIPSLSNIPLLGCISLSEGAKMSVVSHEPKSVVAEQFRGLRSSLQFLYPEQEGKVARIFLITSSISGEGKTFCAQNLAAVMALREQRTLLVGADLRRPGIPDDEGLHNEFGLVNYLRGEMNIEEVLQKVGPFLHLLPSGPIPHNPSELLLHEHLSNLINEIKKNYDYIVMDSPPVGILADAFSLIKHADAVLYILRQGYTPKGMLRFINEKLERGEINNVGFVLNGVEKGSGYGYDYNY